MGIDHDDRVGERIDRRLGRLLRPQQPHRARLAILANRAGHRVERLTELSQLVPRRRGHDLIEVSLGDRPGRLGHGHDRFQDRSGSRVRAETMARMTATTSAAIISRVAAGRLPQRLLVHLLHVSLVDEQDLIFQTA